MSNNQLLHKDMEEEEIYLLITRYLSQQTTSDENEQLVDWMALSKDNEREFERLKSIWFAKSHPTEETSALKALAAVKEKYNILEPATATLKKKSSFRRIQLLTSIAACLLFLTAAIIYLRTEPVANQTIAYLERVTLPRQKLKLMLPDSSVVFLAPESKLRYPKKFAAVNRQVYLEGEAFFEVKHNIRRPFLVKTAKLTTRVLGTSFNIAAFNGTDIKVSLLTGKVEVFHDKEPGHSYRLIPGQQLLLDHKDNQIYRQSFNQAVVCGWMTNKLVFRNIRLADAIHKIENLYGIKIVFCDKKTADKLLWATFENESLDKVLDYLKMAGNVNSRKEGEVIYLTTKNNTP